MISATWWTNSTIYILVYSQDWYHHAVLNLISTNVITVLQYSSALSSIIISFCIIFDICYMMNLPFYIYYRILPVLISTCCIELITKSSEFTLLQHSTTTRWTNSTIYIPEYSQYWFQHAALNLITKSSEFTLLQFSTTLSSIIASFCITFDNCNMMNQQYIYSSILPVLISACRNEFSHYKTWIYSIRVFYNTLKLNHIILYHIWYLQHNEPTVLYIFQNTPSIDISMP